MAESDVIHLHQREERQKRESEAHSGGEELGHVQEGKWIGKLFTFRLLGWSFPGHSAIDFSILW